MTNIFQYSGKITRQNNRSQELAMILPKIVANRLEKVAARGVKAKSSVLTFHGRQSQEVPRLGRLVTNLNLLHLITRGAIQIRHNLPEVTVHYWLGFPKSIFIWIGLAATMFGLPIGIFSFAVESSVKFSLLLSAGMIIGFALLFLLGLALNLIVTIIRFNLFARYCIYEAEKQIEGNVDLTLVS